MGVKDFNATRLSDQQLIEEAGKIISRALNFKNERWDDMVRELEYILNEATYRAHNP